MRAGFLLQNIYAKIAGNYLYLAMIRRLVIQQHRRKMIPVLQISMIRLILVLVLSITSFWNDRFAFASIIQ